MSAAALLHPVQSVRRHLATSLNLSPTDVYYLAIEAFFLLGVIYFALTRAYKPWTRDASPPPLSDADVASKIAAWCPQQLAPPLSTHVRDAQPLDILLEQGGKAGLVTVNGKQGIVNMATCDFLGLLGDSEVEEQCLRTMREYGCGACGPRGFYGTTDVHLECEDKLATFSGTDTAILYSFGAATGSSTIPAFCKRGDLVVADDALCFSLESGVSLSRADVRRFRHSDMHDLERVLQEVVAADLKDGGKRRTQQRRIIIVEGISQNVGDVCPLDQVVALKNKYLFRVMLDESLSIGVMGKTGRGALEHFGVRREDVDIATADLGNAVAAVGGFCVGSWDVVNHQRLSGAGYCFSASQPPFLATAASCALDIITQKGESLAGKLRENVAAFRGALDVGKLREVGWYVDGDRLSPVMHVRSFDEDLPLKTFTTIQKQCLERGVLVARPVYAAAEVKMPKPSVRITVSAAQSRADVQKAAKVLQEVLCAGTF